MSDLLDTIYSDPTLSPWFSKLETHIVYNCFTCECLKVKAAVGQFQSCNVQAADVPQRSF